VRLGGNVVGADASPDNIKMAKLHAQKDPALWRGPGQLDYRHTTAGKEEGEFRDMSIFYLQM
jgi:2-polyprenyl-6-hydroxyphenyl methylase/3-demethylubiquinone-9 3-methyltransferase